MHSSTLLYKGLRAFLWAGGLLVVIARSWTRSKPCLIGSWLLIRTYICQVVRSYFVPTHSTQRKYTPSWSRCLILKSSSAPCWPVCAANVPGLDSSISSGASKMLQIMEWNTLYISMSPLCSRTAIYFNLLRVHVKLTFMIACSLSAVCRNAI